MATKTDNAIPTEAEAKAFLAKGKAVVDGQRKAAKAKAKAKKPAKGKAKAKAKPKHGRKVAQTPRSLSKQARFIEAMRTAKGMSIDEAAKAFGWQKHTVRGAIAGAIKVRLGLKVTAEQDEKRGTVYRIAK